MPLAFAIARLDIPGKLLLIGLAALPLVLPSFVGAYALLLLLGRSGIVTQALNAWGVPFGSIYGTPGIVTVYTLTLYPYVLLPTVAGLKAIDVSVEEAAQSLGSSPARTFRTVTLPIVIPSVLSGALLVFIETIENFGVPAVLAEDKPILAVEAYKLFIGETATNPSAAGVLGVLLIVSDGNGADHPAPLPGEPPLCDRSADCTAADQDRHRLAHRRRPPTAGQWCCWRWCRSLPSSCLSFMEFRGPVLHAAFSLKNYAELFATAQRTARQHAAVCHPCRRRRSAHRCADRLGAGAHALGLDQPARRHRHAAVRCCRERCSPSAWSSPSTRAGWC